MDTVIMKNFEQQIFLKLMNSKDRNLGRNFVLLYRGSRDGWEASDFHKKCDNKGKTVSVICSDTDNIFGGYTSVSWTSPQFGNYIEDNKSFVFLIKSSKNYKPKIFNILPQNKQNAIYHNPKYMCAFRNDLLIHSKCNINESSYTVKYAYNIETKHYLNGDKKNFKVKEIEVFKIE